MTAFPPESSFLPDGNLIRHHRADADDHLHGVGDAHFQEHAFLPRDQQQKTAGRVRGGRHENADQRASQPVGDVSGGGVFGEFISESHNSASPMQLQSTRVF